MSQSENMAAVTEDDNPGQLPVAGDEATGAAAAGELAGEAGDQDGAAQPGEPDARAGSADAAAADAEEAPEEPSREAADLEQKITFRIDMVGRDRPG